jgi:formate hydrogenlyase subunit 3/multisubunit Na+/H+ antiporter MnhD subunit
MRNLFALLALLGIIGIALGVLTILHGIGGGHGTPFNYENYGGPGSILAGLVLLLASLYLRATWPTRR